MTEIHFRGVWWLPESPDRTLSGVVKYSKESGAVLELIGSFREEPESESENDWSHEFVLGLTDAGGEMTLWRCSYSGGNWVDMHYQAQTLYFDRYTVTAAFTHAHLSELPGQQSPSFSGITFRLSGLQDWLMTTGVSESHYEEGSTYTYVRPPEVSCAIESTLFTFWWGSEHRSRRFAIDVQQWASVYLKTATPISITSWIRQFVMPLQELVAFASGKPQRLESVKVEIPDYDDRLGVHDRQLDALFRIWREMEPLPARHYPFDWDLIHGTEFLGQAQDLIARWLVARKQLEPVVQLYLISRFQGEPYPYAEAKLVSAIQALESFFERRRSMNSPCRSIRKQKIREELHATSPEDRQRTIEVLLKPSLRDKLNELFIERDALLEPMKVAAGQFADDLSSKRNEFVHFLPRQRNPNLDSIWLIDAIDMAWCVVESLLLEELGFSRSNAIKRVRGTHRYKMIGARYEVPTW